MKELNNIKRVVSWSSKKNANGTFTAKAYSFGYQEEAVIHAEYIRNTRAQAVAAAKKASIYLKSLQK